MWDQHGYENRMADESWTQPNHCASNWDSIDINKAWGDLSTAGKPNNMMPSIRLQKTANTRQTQPKEKDKHSSKASNQLRQEKVQSEVKKEGFSVFVDESQFPTWDD